MSINSCDGNYRCLFHKYTTSRPVGATLVVARDWAGTRPAPTGAGLTKWTSSRLACARRTVLDPTALERGATCMQMRLSSREAVGKRTAACAMPCHRVSAQTVAAERFRLAHHP